MDYRHGAQFVISERLETVHLALLAWSDADTRR
jgi:hypothetical protein